MDNDAQYVDNKQTVSPQGMNELHNSLPSTASSLVDRIMSLDTMAPYSATPQQNASNSRYSRYLDRYSAYEPSNKPLDVLQDDPAASWIPYIAAALLGVVASVIWFVIKQVTHEGSVMTNSGLFTIGMIIFILVVLAIIAIALIGGHISYINTTGSDRTEVLGKSMFKAAITLGAFVLVWVILMSVAA